MTYYRQRKDVRVVLTPFEALSLLEYLDGEHVVGQAEQAVRRAKAKLGASIAAVGEGKIRRGRA